MNLRPILVGGALLAVVAAGCRVTGVQPIEGGGGGGAPPSPSGNFGATLQPPAPASNPPGAPVLLPPLPATGASPSPSPSPVLDPDAGDAAPVPQVSPLRPGVENPSPLPSPSPSPFLR